MKKEADILFVNGRITTLSKDNDTAEAMAVKDGRILETGKKDDLINTYSVDSMIDLGGRNVYPGFIDAHCHFYGLAQNLQWVDLRGADSFDDVIRRVESRAEQQSGGWLVGRGWDQNLWEGKQFPDRARLDERFPDRPVVLIRVDGHSLLANQAALVAAGIGPGHSWSSQEVIAVNGRLTGILTENAADYLRSLIPAPEGAELSRLLLEAEELCTSQGLTGVTDAGLDLRTLRFIDSLQESGALSIHVSAMLNPTEENIQAFMVNGALKKDRLHVSAVKLYADGSLGSRTALLKNPYTDDPDKTGVSATSKDTIRKYCGLALQYGYQVNIHCIGDSAVKMVLDLYSGFLKGKNDRRWRIEHAQVCDPADLHLFGDYSVIPSVQATHATSDMYWAEDRLGPERLKGAYAYKQLMAQNGWIPNGTDFPIEQVSPLLTFYAATARQDLQGIPEGGFLPENALTRDEALRSITIWAAKANFDEDETGSLEPGKWADFVILDQDVMTIPLSQIPAIQVLETWIHGEKIIKD